LARLRGEAAPERAELDVAADVAHVATAEAAVVEALYGVVDVEAVGRLGRGFDVPLLERQAQGLGDVAREQRLARAGLALIKRGRWSANAQFTASTSASDAM
jgi:hypothetical protein